jgi:hypothetical protein
MDDWIIPQIKEFWRQEIVLEKSESNKRKK